MKILQEEGCGMDCSSYTELMLCESCGITGKNIMFSSNVTPAEDMKKAYDLGAMINLDDYTHQFRHGVFPLNFLSPDAAYGEGWYRSHALYPYGE